MQGGEHLLAALECMGVDNARIEIEGGREVPIVDGSAIGWVQEIIHVCSTLCLVDLACGVLVMSYIVEAPH